MLSVFKGLSYICFGFPLIFRPVFHGSPVLTFRVRTFPIFTRVRRSFEGYAAM